MSKGAIAFAAGFGTGYQNQVEKNQRDDERKEDRAQIKLDNDYRVSERNRVTSEREALGRDGAIAKVTETDAPAPLSTPDLEYGGGLPAPATQRTIAVNGIDGEASKTYGSTIEANLAANNWNAGRSQRISDRLYAQGRGDAAMSMDTAKLKLTEEQNAYGRRLVDEGVLDAAKALRAGDGAGMAAAFNKGGQYKIQGEPVLTPVTRNLPGLGDVPTYTAKFNILGPDGQPREMSVNSHDLSMQTMTFEKQQAALLSGAKEGREGKESTSKIGLQAAQAGYYESAAGAKDAAATKPLHERMSEIDKATLASINRQRETINTAITKGQAEGGFDAASAGGKALNLRLATLSLQESQLHARYGETGAAPADPLGIRKSPVALRAGPSGQAGRDMDQREILEAELVKAKARLSPSDPATQEDVASLTRQIGRLPKSSSLAAPGGVAPTAAQPGVAKPLTRPAGAGDPALSTESAGQARRQSALSGALGIQGNSAIDQITAQKIPVLQAAATRIQGAAQALAAAAKSQDPQALQRYAAELQQTKNQFNTLIETMTPQQAEQVRQAAGYYL